MSRKFGRDSTTDEVIDGIDLSKQKILITGASGGLGAETARALAAAGGHVTIAARDLKKARGVADSIREGQPSAKVSVIHLDLTSLESVRSCAEGYMAENDSLTVLINNAGVMACPLERTDPGWELQLATNHIGHFLLTCRLIPALRAGAPGRVINLSSAGHRLGNVNFEDPHFEHREYDKWSAYGQSKSANILFTVELDRRLASSGVRSHAVHPGMIMTELARHLLPQDIEDLTSRSGPTSGQLAFKPVEAGAATAVWTATAPELEGHGGLYCEDCHVGSEKRSDDSLEGYAAYAMDPIAAGRLWSLSEEWVGESFPSV